MDMIYRGLVEKFYIFINGIDIMKLISTISPHNELLSNLLMINEMNKGLKHVFNIIEFKNGYYFFEYNKFINKSFMQKYNYKIPKNIMIIKYYPIIYNRNYIPKTWIKKKYNALEFNNSKTFELLASYLANIIIKDPDIFKKKKVLYIWGDSNAGKTAVIANPLWYYFGEENVGILSTSKNFQLESLVQKELGILDEYRYSHKRRELDLKLFEGQSLKIDMRYDGQQSLKDLKLIALSNYSIKPEDYAEEDLQRKRTDKALANRTEIFKFIRRDTIEMLENTEVRDLKKIEEGYLTSWYIVIEFCLINLLKIRAKQKIYCCLRKWPKMHSSRLIIG
jgi:hypothetical protein